MQLVSVSGTRGGGKTTLIVELLRRLNDRGRTAAVIVNESGRIAYDSPRAAPGLLDIVYIRGG